MFAIQMALTPLAQVAGTMSYERAQIQRLEDISTPTITRLNETSSEYRRNRTICITVPTTPSNPNPLSEAIFEDDGGPIMFHTEPTTTSNDAEEWENTTACQSPGHHNQPVEDVLDVKIGEDAPENDIIEDQEGEWQNNDNDERNIDAEFRPKDAEFDIASDADLSAIEEEEEEEMEDNVDHDAYKSGISPQIMAKNFLEQRWNRLCDCMRDEAIEPGNVPTYGLKDMSKFWKDREIQSKTTVRAANAENRHVNGEDQHSTLGDNPRVYNIALE